MAQNAYNTKGLKGLKGLNKMQGLYSLSDTERENFYKAHKNTLKKYTGDAFEAKANTLYMNQVFKDTFGQEAFDKYNNNDYESFQLRNQMLKSKLVQDAWVQYASPIYIHNGKKYRDNKRGLGADYEKYSELSEDAKLKLMQSEYLRPIDFDNKWKKDIDRQKTVAKTNATILSPMGFNIGGGVMDATDITHGEAARQIAKEKNQLIIDKIYNSDLKNKKRDNNVVQMVDLVFQKEFENMPEAQVKQNYIKEITKNSYVDANGRTNLGIPEFQAYYGNGTDDEVTIEMSKYSIDDMRHFLAKKKVYDQVFSPGMSQAMLNNEAKDYIYANQNWFKRKWLQAKDFGIATMSYTADKVNGLYTLGLAAEDALSKNKPQVYINENGEVLDPKTEFSMGEKGTLLYKDKEGETHTAHKIEVSRTALHNMGLNMDGSKDNSILSQDYWTKAEQYGLLTSKAQEKAAEIGASPDQLSYGTDGEAGLAYESLKMITFGLADQGAQLIPYGIGVTGKALSTAEKAGKVVKGLGKVMDWTGRVLTAQSKTGAVLQGTAGALGIANAYARGAFPETLQENLLKLDQTVASESYNEVHQQYLNDKEYKATVDQKIANKIAAIRQNYLIKQKEGEQLPRINMAELYSAAQKEVIIEEVANRIKEKQSSQSFADMQEKAIQGASNTAMTTFLPEAVKYGLINTMGFRKYLYTNPASLQKKASKIYKGLSEVTTKEGRQRLAQTTSKFLTSGAKWKQLGKTAASQMWGGTWTNGTDDMMVDGAQRINEDSYNRYLDAYRSGEALTDTYGFTDGVYSYWKGLGNSLGQSTTAHAAIVGGLGSIVSVTPNFTNIVSLTTKAGRKAYKDAYRTNAKKDKDGNVTFSKSKYGFMDKVNFFIQNGILNTYYAKKQTEADNVAHAEYINNILDQYNDFEALEGLSAADYAGQNYTDLGDEKTGEFIKAMEAARAISQLGTGANDPSSLSSVIMKKKALVSALAAYNKNPQKNPLPEEIKENILSNYYAQNPGKVKSDAEDSNALSIVTKNARTMQEAMDAYDNAEKWVTKIEKANKTTFDPQVRHQVKLQQSLINHWKERYNKMKSELGDTSAAPKATGETLIASVGGKQNAEQLIEVYNKQSDDYAEQIKAQQEKTIKAKEELDTTKKAWEEANNKGDSVNKLDAEEAYKDAYAKYEDAKAQEDYLVALQESTQEKRTAISKALQENKEASLKNTKLEEIQAKIDKAQKEKESLKSDNGKLKKGSNTQKVSIEKTIAKLEKQKQSLEQTNTIEEERVLTADEIFGLDAISRARMMNPLNRELYSKKQQIEIEKLERQLNIKDPGALTKIQDIAKLQQRIATSEDAVSRLIVSPEGAAYNYQAQRTQAAASSVRLFNYKAASTVSDFLKEIIENMSEWQKAVSDNRMWNTLNRVPGLKNALEKSDTPDKLVFNYLKRNNPTLIKTIINHNMLPDYVQPMKNAIEWGNTAGMLVSIVDGAEREKSWKDVTKQDIDTIVENATTEKEILDAFEKAINNIKDSNTQKAEDLRWLLKKYNDIEIQKNSVKVKNDTTTEESSQTKKSSSKKTTTKVENTNNTQNPVSMQNEDSTLDLSDAVKQEKTLSTDKEAAASSKDDNHSTGENKEAKTPEGNSQSEESKDNTPKEKNSIYIQDDGETTQAKTPTIEELAEDAKRELSSDLSKSVTIHATETVSDAEDTEKSETEKIDNDSNTLSGNAMAEYVYKILQTLKKLVHKKGDKEGDPMNQYFDWMKAAGIKLQNIIDYELVAIFKSNPNAKIKFMAVKIAQNTTNDVAMQNHLMLVLDYDNSINKGITHIHNEDNGGVIESNGKKYLIIGTVGYGKQNKSKLAWFDVLWNLYKKDGINLKKQRKQWFEEHPNERFFVPENYSTEIVPGYPTPGFIVKQLEKDSVPKDRSIVELIEDKENEGRNPHGLALDSLGWGIQMKKGFITLNTDKEIMSLKDPEGNMGRAFALVPAGNGKMMPIYFKVKKYTEIANGKLKEKIDSLLDDLVNTSYQVRKSAVKQLYSYLYLSPEGDNIMLRRSRAEVTFVSNGEEIATFKLDSDYNRNAFRKAFEKMNPRINVTLRTFKDSTSIREYAEAGALDTDAALLGTRGCSYMIYPLDNNGRIVKPNNPVTPSIGPDSQGGFINTTRKQVIYNHDYYIKENGKYYLNGIEVTDTKIIKQLSILDTILDKSLEVVKTKDTWNYFIMEVGNNPKVVGVEKNSKKVKELSEEESKKVIEEITLKKEKERKARESQQAIEETKKNKGLRAQDVDLNIEQEDSVTIDPETGEIITETPMQSQEAQQESSQLKESQEVSEKENTDSTINIDTTDNIIAKEETSVPQARDIIVHSAQSQKPLTQNFMTLVKDKTYRNRILSLVKKKWPNVDSKISNIEKALTGHGIETNAIGTTKEDIEAWIKTIEDCR